MIYARCTHCGQVRVSDLLTNEYRCWDECEGAWRMFEEASEFEYKMQETIKRHKEKLIEERINARMDVPPR